MKKIKVLYIITGLDIGGAEKALLSTLKGLNHKIFSPVILSLYKSDAFLDAFKRFATKVYCLGYTNKYNPLIIKRIVQCIRIEKPNIIHTHLPHATIWGRIAAYLSGARVVFTTEHNISVWKRRHFFFYLFYKMTYRLNTAIIAVSESIMKMMIKEFGIPRHMIKVIYNGVDLDEISNVTVLPEDLMDLSHPIVGTVGRLHKVKGHTFIIEGFKKVIEDFPKANLLIIGDGDQRECLQELIEELGLDHAIHLLGTRKNVISDLNLFDVFVFPSTEEGLGIALLEACAAGKPCVASNIGGIPEIIENGENGFLVPPSNSTAIAEKVIRLVRDKELCEKLGNRARRVVSEKFSVVDKVNALQKLYLKSMGG